MGFFDLFKNKGQEPVPPEVSYPADLGASVAGDCIPMEQIPDQVFSAGILGVCCGIDPTEGMVYAPADGKISQLTDTRHAIGLKTGDMEILIHVGVDTVDMNGDGFTNIVKMGQSVKKGEPLLSMDLDKIRAAGHPTTVIMAVTNSDEFAKVEMVASGTVQRGDSVLRVTK